MRCTPVLLITLILSACSMLPIPGLGGGGGGQSQATHTQSSTSSSTEEVRVNGRRVDPDEPREHEDEEEDRPRSKKKKKGDDDGDIGKTCHKNHECEADACFVGNGSLGYCTKMCNSWSDCPSHWECKRAGNAPQKICMQDS